MDIERIVVRLLADASQYNRAMDNVEARLVRLAGSAGALSGLISLPVIAATGAVAALGTAFVYAGFSAIKLATQYEQAAVALEVMTGSAEKGKRLLDDITKLAIETPFKTPELLAGAQQLKAFGVETENITNTLRVLGDVSSGVGMEKLSRIILAYGQVRVAGRLMGPELRQFIDAGIPMIDYLAKTLNKPESMIKGMVEDAKVSFTDVAKAFNLMVSEGSLFNNMMDRQSKTVAGRWSAFTETIQFALRNIGLAFFEKFGIAESLDGWVKKIGTGDTAGIDRFMKKVHDGYVIVVGLVKTVVYWTEKAYKATVEWFRENESGLRKAAEWAVRFLVVLTSIVLVLQLIAAAGAALAFAVSPLGQIAAAAALITVLLNELKAFEGFGDSFIAGFNKLKEGLSGVPEALKNAIKVEDWDLVGRILFKSFELAWKTTLLAMKAEWVRFKDNLIEKATPNLIAAADLMAVDADAWAQRQIPGWAGGRNHDEIEKERRAQHDKILAPLLAQERAATAAIAAKTAAIMAEAQPLHDQLKALIEEANKKAEMKADPAKFQYRDILDQNQWMLHGMNPSADTAFKFDYAKTFGSVFNQKDFLEQLRTDPNVQNWYKTYRESNPLLIQNELYNRMGESGITELMKDKNMGVKPQDALEFSTFRGMMKMMSTFNLAQGGAIQGPAQIQLTKQISAGALEYANHLNKEMEKGIWGGQRTGQYSFFEKRLGFAEEAFFGPTGRDGGDGFAGIANRLMKPGAAVDRKTYEFGLFENYVNLQKTVQQRADRMPTAMFRGSSEAQDTINRNMLDQKTVEEEIRDTIMQAKVIQEQQRDYQKQTVDILEKLIKAGVIKTGGF